MLVSVIIPAHNSGAFIQRALQSSLHQTHGELEVIVVDDGSTDNTAQIVKDFADADKRVSLVAHTTAQGPSAARNTGMLRASGHWIAPLDSDDEFDSARLSSLLRIAQEQRLDAIGDGLSLFDFATGASLGNAFDPKWLEETPVLNLRKLLERDWPGSNHAWSLGTMKPMFRSDFVRRHGLRYADDLRLGEDLLFYAELLLSGARFGLSSAPLYRYAVRPGSISRRPRPTEALVEVNRRILAKGSSLDPAMKELLRKRESALKFQMIFWYARAGMPIHAAKTAFRLPAGFVVTQIANRLLKRIGVTSPSRKIAS